MRWMHSLNNMELFQYWPIIFSASILFLLLLHLFNQINRNRPIPIRWPVLGMTPGILANVDRLNDYALGVLRASGGTLYVEGPWFTGYGFLITCDPANAHHMFSTHFSDYPKGNEFADMFDTLGRGIFSVDGELWSRQRRMAHAIMARPSFRDNVAKFSREKVTCSALPLLSCMACRGEEFDLHEFFKRLSMDITSKLVLGVDPGCLAPDHLSVADSISVSFEESEEVFLYRHLVPWWRLLRWLNIGKEKTLSIANEKINRFIERCVEDRKNNQQSRSYDDVLSYYMHNQVPIGDDNDDTYFASYDFLRDTLVTFIGAGKDTTAAALTWFFYLLSKNPSVAQTLVDELSMLRKTEEKQSNNVLFEADELESATYLHAALCEALRLFAPVPFNHKTAIKHDVLPSGHQVGPGTSVVFSTYSTGRMESIWGEDCLEFRPERWIDGDGGIIRVPSVKFMAFHSGPRACAGKNMAMTVMKEVAAAVAYNFSFEGVDGCVVEPRNSIVLAMKNGFMVKANRREHF